MIDWEPLHSACMAVFGQAVTHCPPGRREQPITAVFDEAYRSVLPMGGADGQEGMQWGAAGNVTDAAPVLGVQLSQFHQPPDEGDGIRIGSGRTMKLFSIKEVQPDGHGAAKLLLLDA